MPVIYFSQEDLNEVDLKIKRLLTERGAKHPKHLNSLLYASRSIGRRGLKQIASVFKETKIKTTLRLVTSADLKLQAVAKFQQVKEGKGRRSILKDARKYAIDLGLVLELGDEPTLSLKTPEGRSYIAPDLSRAKKVLARRRMVKSTSEVKESTWQGNIVAHRLNDSSLELQECFSWSTKWRSAPTYTICGINEIV